MGIYSFFQNVLMFSVQYGGAAALETMKWKVSNTLPRTARSDC